MATRLMILLLLAVSSQVTTSALLFKGDEYMDPVPFKDQVHSKTRIQPRIIAGLNAKPGQFPYQAGVYGDRRVFCGGSLISPNWVLTAGHCVDGLHLFTVYLGAVLLNTQSETGRIIMESRTFHKHENYFHNKTLLLNDIAVIKLHYNAPLNDRINVIPLPPRQYNSKNFELKEAQVSGWGKVNDSPEGNTNILQYADLFVISNKLCKMTYKHLTEEIFCAFGPDRESACSGDSGGPLAIIDDTTNATTHFGVISFVSPLGCESGLPSGFVKTSKYLDWIHLKTGIPIQD